MKLSSDPVFVPSIAEWNTLNNAARMAAGQQIRPVETGGFGSDTDPGVTGGYGDPGVIDAQDERLPDLSQERPFQS